MKIKYSESFAGIGAWGKAIQRVTERHGDTCELQWYAEIDKYASNAFAAIHDVSEELNIWDITQDIEVKHMDIFFYSPPCQTFSIAGKRELTSVPKGNLFYDAVKFIDQQKPKYAIMENVKGLPTGDSKKDFYNMINYLEELGYVNYWKILNSVNYGIPHNRERVFIISIRKDLYENGKRFEFPKEFKLKISLEDLLEKEGIPLKPEEVEKISFDGVLPIGYYAADFRYDEGFRIRKNKISPCLKANMYKSNDMSNALYKFKVKSANKKGYETIEPGDSVNTAFPNSETRRGRRGKSVSNTLLTQPEQGYFDGKLVFKYTTIDCFRLQGFDDYDHNLAKENFLSCGLGNEKKAISELYKRAGNSITVNVIEELLENLLYDRKQEGQQLSLF